MPLDSVANYKTWAGITGTALDTRIGLAIASAQELLERACGRPAGGFESATWTQDFDSEGWESIQLPCAPVTSITSVSLRDGSGNLSALGASEYDFDAAGRLHLLGGVNLDRWAPGRAAAWNLDVGTQGGGAYGRTSREPGFPAGFKAVRVVYVGGYSAIPADLLQLVREMTAETLAAQGNDPTMQAESIGAYSYTKAKTDASGRPWWWSRARHFAPAGEAVL